MKKNIDEINIVILNYNDSETTLKLIESIHEYPNINKIIVVDNNSTDDSVEVIKNNFYPKVIVLKSMINGGYGAGNNLGIEYITKNFEKCNKILICNPDVEFSSDLIDDLAMTLNKDVRTMIVSTIAYRPNGDLQQPTAWPIPSRINYIVSSSIIFNKIFLQKKNYYDKDYIFSKRFVPVDCVPGSLLMIKTEILDSTNKLYDENMFLYGEETYLGLKYKKNENTSILYTKNSYIHNHSVSINKTINSEAKQRRMILDSRLYLLKKYYKVNLPILYFAKLFYSCSMLEYKIISFLKKRKKKNGK